MHGLSEFVNWFVGAALAPGLGAVARPIEGGFTRYRSRDSNLSAEEAGAEALEVALAGALADAAEVGEWGLVERLARELEERRLARGGAP